MFSAINSLHWPAPTAVIHNRVISQFSLYYPEKTISKPKFSPLLRPALMSLTILGLMAIGFLFTLKPKVVYAGNVENLIGKVEILNRSIGSWKAVYPGQSVPVGAKIRTAEESQVTITFPGGEKTLVASQSEIFVESIEQAHGYWEISLDQISGQTETLTSTSTSSFSIETSAGVINSNQAHFVMEVEEDGSVTTDVFEGAVNTFSHSEQSMIHSGQTLVFPSSNNAAMSSPFYRENTIVPSLMPLMLDEATKTPKNNEKEAGTATPKNNPGNAEDTKNSDSQCNPGNSNGNGNSENANNPTEACK